MGSQGRNFFENRIIIVLKVETMYEGEFITLYPKNILLKFV